MVAVVFDLENLIRKRGCLTFAVQQSRDFEGGVLIAVNSAAGHKIGSVGVEDCERRRVRLTRRVAVVSGDEIVRSRLKQSRDVSWMCHLLYESSAGNTMHSMFSPNLRSQTTRESPFL